jgi:ABC-type histidine transport system ATPase subunit
MQHMPALEMRLKDFGEQLIGHLALHQAEIQQYVQAGVERALAQLGEQIIDEASRLAAQRVHEEMKHYLTYGTGGQAIRAAVERGLAPLVAMLHGSPTEEGTDGRDVAHR